MASDSVLGPRLPNLGLRFDGVGPRVSSLGFRVRI